MLSAKYKEIYLNHHKKIQNRARESRVMANIVIFHPFYGWVGRGAHLEKVHLVLIRDQKKLLGPSRSAKKVTHIYNGGGPK